VTPESPVDFSERSLEEVLRSEVENRAWNKKLRLENTALVDRRLAKKISQEEYTLLRQSASEDAAECKRQRTILVQEIRCRHDIRASGE
jgi:hypothetical protein